MKMDEKKETSIFMIDSDIIFYDFEWEQK